MSSPGTSARSAVSSSVSVEPGRRARPPGSCSSSWRVLTRLPLWPTATAAARTQPVGRLGVLPDRRTGRRVAAMGDGELAAQRRQATLVEDLCDHAEVLVDHHALAVADRHARPTPGRGAGARRAPARRCGGLPRRRAWTPTTPHIAQPSQPRARGSAVSQAWRGRATATSSASATPPPRSSAAPVAPPRRAR